MTKDPKWYELKSKSSFYLSKKFYSRALESINELISLFPNEELGWTLKGETLVYLREFEKAYKNIKTALDLDPKSTVALHIFSFLEVIRGDYEVAIKILKESLEIYPFFTDYICLLNEDQLRYLYTELKKDPKIDSKKLKTLNNKLIAKCTQEELPQEDFEKKHFESLYLNIKEIIKKRNLKGLSKIYESNSWDSLSIDNMKILLEDTELNLLENILRISYPIIFSKNFNEIWNYYHDYLLPERVLIGLRDLIKKSIIKLIKEKDKGVLIPLFVYNCLSILDLEDIIPLIMDPNVKFMVLIYQTLSTHYEQLLFFLGDERLFDLINDFFNIIKKINFEEFEISVLKNIEKFYKKKLPKYKFAYLKNFDLIFITIQQTIKKKKRKQSEFNFRELIQIINLVSKGKDDIADGAIGLGGYGFVFRDIEYVKKYLNEVNYYPPLVEVGKMRNLKNNFNKKRPLEYFDFIDFDVNLLLTASVITLIPSLELKVGDTFFVTWVLIKIPSGEVFPANFYYDKRRMAIGCINPKSEDIKNCVPNEFLEIFQFNPFDLSQKERDTLAHSFELALNKVPTTDFKAVFSSFEFHYDVEVEYGEPYWKIINENEDDNMD